MRGHLQRLADRKACERLLGTPEAPDAWALEHVRKTFYYESLVLNLALERLRRAVLRAIRT